MRKILEGFYLSLGFPKARNSLLVYGVEDHLKFEIFLSFIFLSL